MGIISEKSGWLKSHNLPKVADRLTAPTNLVRQKATGPRAHIQREIQSQALLLGWSHRWFYYDEMIYDDTWLYAWGPSNASLSLWFHYRRSEAPCPELLLRLLFASVFTATGWLGCKQRQWGHWRWSSGLRRGWPLGSQADPQAKPRSQQGQSTECWLIAVLPRVWTRFALLCGNPPNSGNAARTWSSPRREWVNDMFDDVWLSSYVWCTHTHTLSVSVSKAMSVWVFFERRPSGDFQR